MIKTIFIALLLFCTLASAAEKQYGSIDVDEVTSIYDGDTFTVNIKKWPAIIGDRMKIRVKGIDTPELRAGCRKELVLAREAKQYTVGLFRNAKRIELLNLERDKYFRILADVRIDGQDLGEQLVRRNLARRYDGGKKISWCS